MKRKTITLIFIVVVILWIVLGFGPVLVLKQWSHRGTYGDMFGSVNALFSGLALGGVIVAILLQSKELSLQRQELEMTRKELKRSALAHEESADELSKQVATMRHSTTLMAYSQLIGECDRRIREILEDQNLSVSGRETRADRIREEREQYLVGTREMLDNLTPKS